jgi:hypothetical protein
MNNYVHSKEGSSPTRPYSPLEDSTLQNQTASSYHTKAEIIDLFINQSKYFQNIISKLKRRKLWQKKNCKEWLFLLSNLLVESILPFKNQNKEFHCDVTI